MDHRAAAVTFALTVSISCASAQAPHPLDPPAPAAPIREFDIATIEGLARQMYAQDRIAWTATDVLLAQVTAMKAADKGVEHWVTGTRDGHNIVRFIRIGEQGPEAGYDVVFAGLADPTISIPADRALDSDEMAQYNARTLALANIPNRCSDRYNTIALKDPESDGWLVWALAATLEPDLILIGGHSRFTISADGKAIRARDALSTNCLRFERKGEQAEISYFMTHIVSLTPVETHAFASLTYGKVLHVGTEDGGAWRVDAGRIVRVEQDSPGEDGFAARALAGIDEMCSLITSKNGDAAKQTDEGPVVKVIEATEQAETFSVEAPSGTRVDMIGCNRKDIVPAPNDYKVVAAGYQLMIGDYGAGHPRRYGLLRRIRGRFEFDVFVRDANGNPQLAEPLPDELARRVRARLDGFDRAMQTQH